MFLLKLMQSITYYIWVVEPHLIIYILKAVQPYAVSVPYYKKHLILQVYGFGNHGTLNTGKAPVRCPVDIKLLDSRFLFKT